MTIENDVLRKRKTAVVTGGSRGIGKDIALSLACMGIGVVLTYQSNKAEGIGSQRRFKPQAEPRWRCR